MRRLVSPASAVAASAACLLFLGSTARAHAAPGPFEQAVASWMGVVAVIGADGDEEAAAPFGDATDEDTFEIDEDAADERPHREPRHRGDDRPDRERRHHRGGHPHGGRHHPGMGPERMGPPGGPDMQRAARRAFHEIIRRLGRIERKLGIESGPSAGPESERPRRPRPEMDRPRGNGGFGERRDIPDDVRRRMEERMEEGRRRMEEAQERMDEARRKFRDMEERIRQLEAEVARLEEGR
jgi:hypothetical protein